MKRIAIGAVAMLWIVFMGHAWAADFPVQGSNASGRPGERVFLNLTYNYDAGFNVIVEDLMLEYPSQALTFVPDASMIDIFGAQRTLREFAQLLRQFAQAHQGNVLENLDPVFSLPGQKGYALSFYVADGTAQQRSGPVHLSVAFDIPLTATPGTYSVSFGNSVLVNESQVEFPYPAALQNLQVTVSPPGSSRARVDFNGDSKSDIFWRHANGTNYLWLLNGAQITSQGLLPSVGDGWSVVGIGDFNGDGKADILWRHTDGTNVIWLLDGSIAPVNGLFVLAGAVLLPAVAGPDWSVVGIGDFNGDGKADVLWRHTNGTNYVWHVDASVISNGVASIPSQGLLPGVPALWTIVGIGDFNGDGKSDIFWRHSDGTNYVWHIDGTIIAGGVLSIASQGLLPGVPSPWAVAGIGDFNGDGKSDILWRHSDGTNYVWQVNGSVISGGVLSIASQGLLPGVADAGWNVVGTGDHNGDGKADVLWRHTDGTNYLWHIDGSVITGGVLSIPSQGLLPGVPDLGWVVQNPK